MKRTRTRPPVAIALKAYVCLRCGHSWLPRKAAPPQTCANRHCQSEIWWKPKKEGARSDFSKKRVTAPIILRTGYRGPIIGRVTAPIICD